jgi:hypothetical protein
MKGPVLNEYHAPLIKPLTFVNGQRSVYDDHLCLHGVAHVSRTSFAESYTWGTAREVESDTTYASGTIAM